MNIANLNPAERMKAFGLVGVIIVMLFFVVHTLLGAVAPKKQTGSASGGSGQTGSASAVSGATGVPGPPAPAGTVGSGQTVAGTGQPGDAFPMDKAFASAKKVSDLERNVPDPFVQIREPENGAGSVGIGSASRRAGMGKGFVEPKVEIRPDPFGGAPRQNLGGLPALGSVPLMGASIGSGPAPLTLAPVEPEIRVIGIVLDGGSAPIATISVGGQIQLARPGDELAKGWRLKQVTEEGVVVRHKGELLSWRVGAAINMPVAK
jgi:hypothetical protein